jgi:hypothetical protein
MISFTQGNLFLARAEAGGNTLGLMRKGIAWRFECFDESALGIALEHFEGFA